MLADFRQSLRQLRKSPGFTVTAVLTLALGIGATTAIFTLIEQVMLRTMPVVKPGELWKVGDKDRCCNWGGYTQGNADSPDDWTLFSWEAYKQFRDNTPAFTQLAAFQAGNTQLGVRPAGSREQSETRNGEFVSGNFFQTFGVEAWRGRLLTPADDHEGAPPVAVLSYRTWLQHYGADPGVVGRSYLIDGHPFTVVGIATPSFYGAILAGWGMPDFWMPLTTEPLVDGATSRLKNANTNFLDLIGRVKPGTSSKALEAQLRGELHGWLASHVPDMQPQEKETWQKQTLHLVPGGAGVDSMADNYGNGLKLLLAAAGCVLLVACANLANLLLARGLKDRQQTSIRVALGASRGRLVRKALAESVTLGVLGGVAAIGVAYGGARLVIHLAFQIGGPQNWVPIDVSPSWTVLGFALGISVLTGVLFGIAPAWITSHAEPVEALRGAAGIDRDKGEVAAEGAGGGAGSDVSGAAERGGAAGAEPAKPAEPGFRIYGEGPLSGVDEYAADRLSRGPDAAAVSAYRRAAGGDSRGEERGGGNLCADERGQLEHRDSRGGAAGAGREGRYERRVDAGDAGIL